MNPEKKKGFYNLLKKVVKEETIEINGVVFLQEKPTHTRFTPSTVPSILKGMTPSISVKKQVAYEELENRLKREPEELLIFSSEETPLVTVEEVEIEKKSEKNGESNHFFKKNEFFLTVYSNGTRNIIKDFAG